MKSWADHCSSDEESEGENRRKSEPVNDDDDDVDNAGRNIVTAKEMTREETQEDIKGNNDDDTIPPPLPLADFPTNHPQFQEVIQDLQGPPYSAHVGNLSFRIQTNELLSRTLEGLVDYRYEGQEKVHVSSARIALDRETKKSRGFANVYFDTIDELIIFLNLNDGHSFIENRQIRLNVATPSTTTKPTQKYGDIDGSKFRGGKFSRNESKVPHSASRTFDSAAAPESSSLTRKNTSTSDSSLGRSTSTASGTSTATADKPRKSLNLMPRSKPANGADVSDNKVSADIFGGAKPRDESRWTNVKASAASGTDQEKTKPEAEPSNSVPAKKSESEVVVSGTTVEDVELKTEPAKSKSSNQHPNREKKNWVPRGPRDVEHEHSNANGRPQRTDVHHDERTKRWEKGTKAERHESKSKDSASRATKEKVNVNADGWEEAPVIQKEKRVVAPVVPLAVEEPRKAAPTKKPTNAFELLSYDSDSD